MKIVLIGYYGWRNLGDDLFVEQLTRHLLKQSQLQRLTILCEECYYRSSDPRVEYCVDAALSKLQRLKLMVQANYVIWGGGSVDFGTAPKKMTLMRRSTQWTGGKFQFWGIGLEKVEVGESPEAIANTRLFQRSSFLYLRDPDSYGKVKRFHPNPDQYRLGGDLALLDPELYQPWRRPEQLDAPAPVKTIGFCGKFWWGQGRADFYGDQLRPWVEKHGATVHCLPAHSGTESNDNQFHEKLRKTLPEGSCILHDWDSYTDFLERLSTFDVYISNRLHGVIAADMLGIPNLGITSESKITHYITKSAMVPDLRLAEFMTPIAEAQLQALVDQYHRPTAFINAESQAAQQAIAQALGA